MHMYIFGMALFYNTLRLGSYYSFLMSKIVVFYRLDKV